MNKTRITFTKLLRNIMEEHKTEILQLCSLISNSSKLYNQIRKIRIEKELNRSDIPKIHHTNILHVFNKADMYVERNMRPVETYASLSDINWLNTYCFSKLLDLKILPTTKAEHVTLACLELMTSANITQKQQRNLITRIHVCLQDNVLFVPLNSIEANIAEILKAHGLRFNGEG